MEKIMLTVALGSQVLSRWNVPVYWTLYFGREDLLEMLRQEHVELDESWFEKIRPIIRKDHYNFVQEHFIIRHRPEGIYTIEDRNNPPLTYVNSTAVDKRPLILNSGDVIAIPISRYGKAESCFLQFAIRPSEPTDSASQFGQLMQCSKTAKKFMVYWEEDPASRHHFGVRIETSVSHGDAPSEGGVKNLRPASETPCPYCGNKYTVYCTKCKLFICYNGVDDNLRCNGCKQNYTLKEEDGNDIDIKTYR